MRLLLVCTLAAGAIPLSGCFSGSDSGSGVSDTMAQTPFMYKSDVQQGNVITQEQVNKLEPGMSKNQVRYIMGTPMLVDTFHQNRWDYLYSMKQGGKRVEKRRISLTFKDDQLASIEGDLRPEPDSGDAEKETVVSVPDNKQRTGILDGALQAVGLQDDGKPKAKKKEEPKEIKTKLTSEAVSRIEQAPPPPPPAEEPATPLLEGAEEATLPTEDKAKAESGANSPFH